MSPLQRPTPRPGVLDIEIYVPGKSSAPGVAKVYKLSSNETPFGPSPKALDSLKHATHLEAYPDGTAIAFRQAIGKAFGLDPNRIVGGAGSDECLSFLATVYLQDGDEAIYTDHGFLMYAIYTLGRGAKPVAVPEKNYTADVDAIIRAVTPRTKIVFIANPNNPTGTYLPFDEIKRLHAGLPPHVLLVIDAAYSEYVRKNDYQVGIELVADNENVVMLRTFSKIHGLAAMRVGWMYAPAHVVDACNRVRGPFNLSTPAMRAAIASLEDPAHIEKARAHNDKWLPWLTDEIARLGLTVTPSVANFLLIHFKDADTATKADAFLTAKGLILRRVVGYKLPAALRMTVGDEEPNRMVVEALREFVGKQK